MGCCEFNGDRTCPQCRGLGRVRKKPMQNELTSLLSPDDVRLQPSRTKLYTIIGVCCTLMITACIVIFFFPRNVMIRLDEVKTIHSNTSEFPFNITVQELITVDNDNFISVKVKKLSFQWSYFGQPTAQEFLYDLTIPARSNIVIAVKFDVAQNLTKPFKDRVQNNCRSDPLEESQILMKYTVIGDVVYLSQHRQIVLDDVMYVRCGDDYSVNDIATE
eukprot:CFRG6409T1